MLAWSYLKSFSRVLFFSLMTALGMTSLVPTAQATRINVFEHELGSLGTGVWKDAMNQRALNLLDGNDIDFGYFHGTKSISYFLLQSENYTVLKKGLIDNNIPSRTFFTFKTARYEIVPLCDETDYDSEVGSNIFIAYLLRDKVTGKKYLCLHAAGEKFDTSTSYKINTYCKPLLTLTNRCLEKHSDARLIVFHSGSATYAKTYSELLKYFNGEEYANLKLLVSEETAGGLHSGTNSCAQKISHFVSSTKVWDNASADYPLVATLAYPHDVNFTDDDGTVLKSEVVDDGEAATAPPSPSKAGFEFAGWNPSDFSNVTNDMMIVATYKAAEGSAIVTFKDEDETVIETKSVKMGETVTPPDDPPTKEGHALAAWLKDGAPYDFATPVSASFDLIASFTANVYTVTFQYEDGDVIDTQHVAYMQSATAPANPTPKDPTQVFFRWDRDFSSIVEDTVVTAIFLNQHTDVGTATDFLAYVAAGLPANATLTLTNDLDFTGLAFTPSDFAATLDGNGRTVTGLSTAPLFNVVSGTVKDLVISNCNWTKSATARFLADKLYGATLSGCSLISCKVTGRVYNGGVGGFADYARTNEVGRCSMLTNCVARNCEFTYDARQGVVIGGLVRYALKGTLLIDCAFETDDVENAVLGGPVLTVGGLVGQSICATFVRCRNNVPVLAGYSGGDSCAGGIVGTCFTDTNNIGTAPSVFIACTNVADVVSQGVDGAAGGIVGRSEKTNISFEACRNDGEILMKCNYDNPQSKQNTALGAGGIIGGVYSPVTLSMSRCVNFGTVSNGLARIAGGLAGNLNSSQDGADLTTLVTNCVNHGAVVGGSVAGGLFGRHCGIVRADVVNCGNTGDISCPTGYVGGVYGLVNAVRKNNAQSITLDDVRNVMNAGRVMTESGFAGGYIGMFVGSAEHEYKGSICGNNYKIAPTNLVLTTAVTAGEGGVTSNIIANIVLRGRTVTVADVNTHYLSSEGFTNVQAKRILNDWVLAQETSYPKWIQAKNWPDLEIFSEPFKGLILFIR